MKSSFLSRFVITLLLAVVACKPQIPRTATPTDIPPTPTPDFRIITPENIDRLVQIKQLGMGMAIGSPLYSPDGKWLFQATTTGAYSLDKTSSENGRLLISNTSPLIDKDIMDISPDGKILAMGDDLVWIESGQKLKNMEFLPENTGLTGAWTVKFSPDGSLIARGYYNQKTGSPARVGVWQLADGKLLQTFEVNSEDGLFEFSADGHLLSIQTMRGEYPFFDVYDIQSGKRLTSWAGERSVSLPENRFAVESKGTIRIFDLAKQKALHAFSGEFAAFSSDGQLVVLLNFGQFKIYRVSDEQQQGTLEGDFKNNNFATLRFSPDGQTLAGYTGTNSCCGGHEGKFYLWHAADGTLIKKVDEPGASDLFNFSPDGKSLAITDRVSTTQVLSTSDGSLQSELGGYITNLTGVAFLPNSQGLVISVFGNVINDNTTFPGIYHSPLFFYNIDKGILDQYQPAMKHNAPLALSTDRKVYSPDDLRDLPLIKDIKAPVSSIAFSPDGKKVAVGYNDDLYVWDLSKKALLFQSSVCPSAHVSSLAFSPDGQRLARVCSGILEKGEPTMQVWEAVPEGKLLLDISTDYDVFMVTFSPDGRFIAAGGEQVGVWDASEGKPLFTIHEAVINEMSHFGRLGLQTMAFSPNGRILAINPMPGSVELWAVEGQRKIFPPAEGISLSGVDIDFSPDGKLLAIGLDVGGAQIYGIK